MHYRRKKQKKQDKQEIPTEKSYNRENTYVML